MRSDLVRVDFSTPKVSALEFPRDLWVEIPHISDNLNGQDHEKLNQAFLYGQPGFKYWDDPCEGSGLMALTLNKNFGANIDHYITVNMRTFEHIIDAMGGIDVEVKDEKTAKTSGLKVGTHHLNGAEALKLARNRSGGSFERADNQNLVVCAVRKKITSPQILAQVPALIETFQDNIRTDLTPAQLSQLACLGTQMPPRNIALASFPGDLFKQTRVFDPVFDKRIAILDADFVILTDFVTRFQMGTWPRGSRLHAIPRHRRRRYGIYMPVNHTSIPLLDAAAVLKRYGLRPDKKLGQNFLQDSSALEKIADAAEIQADDCVLEIGPGLGSLTRYLAGSARSVAAVELDPDLLAPLKAVLTPHPNMRIIHGDILELSISDLVDQPGYIAAANIPYNITSEACLP
ncbi:MAG: LCP family protein [Anaerolineales bacterium]|nr:LCP family protein [Anaerolineales bacterium]